MGKRESEDRILAVKSGNDGHSDPAERRRSVQT